MKYIKKKTKKPQNNLRYNSIINEETILDANVIKTRYRCDLTV
jgi:hypothetical protein